MAESVIEQVFDEEISLRRFQVALKRADWRMFEQALERLNDEIVAGAAFGRHQDWQDCAKAANERGDVPDGLPERFRDALGRLLSVEARVAAAAPAPAGLRATAPAVAVVAGWRSSLDDERARAAFTAWLLEPGAVGAAGARALLLRWLDEGVGLSAIAHRANLAVAAAGAGLALADPPWVDVFYAGLARALDAVPAPPLTRLGDALAELGGGSLVVAEVGSQWERHYAGSPLGLADGAGSALELIKLAGSLDRFACQRCGRVMRTGGGARGIGLQPCPTVIAVACDGCHAPAWPLVVPLDQPSFRPPAARQAWERAAERLARSGTWVLVEPAAPAGDPFAAWLVGCLTPGTRVLVVGDTTVHEAWQTFLASHSPGAVVTSRGPADEVLAYLLQGGVPALEPVAAERPAFGAKKKNRR